MRRDESSVSRYGAGPPDQGDAGGGDLRPRRANCFLAEYWVPLWNERFTVDPRDAFDAHRPLPPGIDLEGLFAETEIRKVAHDFTIRFKNRYWQIREREALDVLPGAESFVSIAPRSSSTI